MRLAATLSALASFALALGGCFLSGFDVGGGGGASSSSTSATGGGGAGGAPPQLCESEGLPPRPQVTSTTSGAGGGGGAAPEPLRFALRNFDFGDAPPGEPARTDLPGLDLDRSCTCCECISALEACTPPPFATAASCDGERSVDNAFARLISLVGANATSDALNADVNDGVWTILVELSGYNGLPDDDQVRVALYTTSGHKTNPDPDVLPSMPAWQGDDEWMRRADSVGPANEPLVYTDQAYVTGGVLVGELEGFLSLGGSLGSRVNFRGGLVRARLTEVEGRTVLREGVIGGRWPLEDIFAALSSIRILGQPVCTNSLGYSTVKSSICKATDVYSRGVGANLCDALSFGMSFDAEPVLFAAALGQSTATPGCADPATDPANDCCERVMPTDPCPR